MARARCPSGVVFFLSDVKMEDLGTGRLRVLGLQEHSDWWNRKKRRITFVHNVFSDPDPHSHDKPISKSSYTYKRGSRMLYEEGKEFKKLQPWQFELRTWFRQMWDEVALLEILMAKLLELEYVVAWWQQEIRSICCYSEL